MRKGDFFSLFSLSSVCGLARVEFGMQITNIKVNGVCVVVVLFVLLC